MADQEQGETRAIVELKTSPEMERVLTEQMRAAGATIGQATAVRASAFGIIACCNSL
jgi:hypothetical protein